MAAAEAGGLARERAAALAASALGSPAVALRRLGGGHANTMVAVRAASGRRAVVRLYERRPEVARVEHAVLERAAGVVPVPEVILADPDGLVAGQPALVQRHVDGVLAGTALADAGADEAARVGALLGGTLAALRGIAFPRAGFFHGPDLDPRGMDGGLGERLEAYLEETLGTARARGADPRLLAGWRGLVLDTAARVGEIDDGAVLVHADYNPKNVLLEPARDRRRVAAVLDWEFAFAGSWLHDLGNLTRFAEDHPPGYAAAVARGARDAGAPPPEGWRHAAAVFDAFSVAEFLARGPGAAGYAEATRLVARALARGDLVPHGP